MIRRLFAGFAALTIAATACTSSRDVSDLEDRVAALEATTPSDDLVTALEDRIDELERTNDELLSLVAVLSTQGQLHYDFGVPFHDPGAFGGGFELAPDGSGAAPQVIPPPDFSAAIPADDGKTRPLGTVTALPGEDHLNFLFEFCDGDSCFRDAHFMDPDDPLRGSGPWTAGRPFHIRHGFPSEAAEPLGPGYDVAVYVTRWGGVRPNEDFEDGITYRYSADYVLRGTTDHCGPTYRTQSGPATCEWFVHDFPDGLPEGRYDLWVVWEAPCSYWQEIGFTDACADADEVMSLFSAGVNSPFDEFFVPEFAEENQAPRP